MKSELLFSPKKLLWKTRGRLWDFEFVAVPLDPAQHAWSSTLSRILGEGDAGPEPIFRAGVMRAFSGSAYPYVGACWLDPELKDWTNRPIPHYMVWFPSSDTSLSLNEMVESVPSDWHWQILEHYKPVFLESAVFGLTEGEIQDLSKVKGRTFGSYLVDHLRNAVGDLRFAIELGEPTDQWQIVPEIPFARISEQESRVSTNVARSGSPASVSPALLDAYRNSPIKTKAKTFVEHVMNTIAGQVAIRLRPSFGSVQEELSRRLSDAFNGAVDDVFIQALVEASYSAHWCDPKGVVANVARGGLAIAKHVLTSEEAGASSEERGTWGQRGLAEILVADSTCRSILKTANEEEGASFVTELLVFDARKKDLSVRAIYARCKHLVDENES